jgi:hypothetical protein
MGGGGQGFDPQQALAAQRGYPYRPQGGSSTVPNGQQQQQPMPQQGTLVGPDGRPQLPGGYGQPKQMPGGGAYFFTPPPRVGGGGGPFGLFSGLNRRADNAAVQNRNNQNAFQVQEYNRRMQERALADQGRGQEEIGRGWLLNFTKVREESLAAKAPMQNSR